MCFPGQGGGQIHLLDWKHGELVYSQDSAYKSQGNRADGNGRPDTGREGKGAVRY